MMTMLNAIFCLAAFAAAFGALVQVAACGRAFDPRRRWERWLVLAALVVWMLHAGGVAVEILNGGYPVTLWTSLRWLANAAICMALMKILARFERLEMTTPARSALLSRRPTA